MSEPADAKPKRASKQAQTKPAPDPAKTTKHKKWVKEVEAAQLVRLLRRDEADVAKALKKSGVSFTRAELGVSTPETANQQVVLYKREGKLVGYAVGATSAPARKPAAQKPAAEKPAPAADKTKS